MGSTENLAIPVTKGGAEASPLPTPMVMQLIKGIKKLRNHEIRKLYSLVLENTGE